MNFLATDPNLEDCLMYRTALACCAAVLAFAATARADSKLEFKPVESEAGRFTAVMPGTPKEDVETWGNGTKYYTLKLNPNGIQFMICYFDNPNPGAIV